MKRKKVTISNISDSMLENIKRNYSVQSYGIYAEAGFFNHNFEKLIDFFDRIKDKQNIHINFFWWQDSTDSLNSNDDYMLKFIQAIGYKTKSKLIQSQEYCNDIILVQAPPNFKINTVSRKRKSKSFLFTWLPIEEFPDTVLFSKAARRMMCFWDPFNFRLSASEAFKIQNDNEISDFIQIGKKHAISLKILLYSTQTALNSDLVLSTLKSYEKLKDIYFDFAENFWENVTPSLFKSITKKNVKVLTSFMSTNMNVESKYKLGFTLSHTVCFSSADTTSVLKTTSVEELSTYFNQTFIYKDKFLVFTHLNNFKVGVIDFIKFPNQKLSEQEMLDCDIIQLIDVLRNNNKKDTNKAFFIIHVQDINMISFIESGCRTETPTRFFSHFKSGWALRPLLDVINLIDIVSHDTAIGILMSQKYANELAHERDMFKENFMYTFKHIRSWFRKTYVNFVFILNEIEDFEKVLEYIRLVKDLKQIWWNFQMIYCPASKLESDLIEFFKCLQKWQNIKKIYFDMSSDEEFTEVKKYLKTQLNYSIEFNIEAAET